MLCSWLVCAQVWRRVVIASSKFRFWLGLSLGYGLDSLINSCYFCLVCYPWRKVRHLCLAIQTRACFLNDSLSRLRCSGVVSTYGWVTILLYCIWLNDHTYFSNRWSIWILLYLCTQFFQDGIGYEIGSPLPYPYLCGF